MSYLRITEIHSVVSELKLAGKHMHIRLENCALIWFRFRCFAESRRNDEKAALFYIRETIQGALHEELSKIGVSVSGFDLPAMTFFTAN